MNPHPETPPRRFSGLWLAGALGLFSFATVLAFHNLADGDLWAKLALGASVWDHGDVMRHDLFAFTPTLPIYIDHEWGAGLIFFTGLKWFGPPGLMLLKITLALAALGTALAVARRQQIPWPLLLLLAIPCGWCVLPGFAPVIRSHALTYLLFAVTLWCLEKISAGQRAPALALVGVMGLWANLHGGFVVGLGMAGIYTLLALPRHGHWRLLGLTTLAALAVTFVNPYGADFWRYLLPALRHPRPLIAEWQPMPLWGTDSFLGFRVLFLIAVVALAVNWRQLRNPKSWPGLAVLAVTAYVTWRSRRHAPFFGLAGLMFLGTHLEPLWLNVRANWRNLLPLAAHGALAVFVAARFLPQASLQVLAPVGAYPVREADILSRAGVAGNLAVPFPWGSYATWRLFPRIKVSMDGRYEEIYPEPVFLLNHAFHFKEGADWARLVRDYPVDFVILDLRHDPLRPEDLTPLGYALVWRDDGNSALLAAPGPLAALRRAALELPPTTIEPLDATIPQHWWAK